MIILLGLDEGRPTIGSSGFAMLTAEPYVSCINDGAILVGGAHTTVVTL